MTARPRPDVARTHVALLRGINVSGHNRLAMRGLRETLDELGFEDVLTYLQSGNAVFRAGPLAEEASLAESIGEALHRQRGLRVGVVVRERAAFERVLEANPFAEVSEGASVHVVLFRNGVDDDVRERVERAQAVLAETGEPDEVRIVSRALYLWTPGGFAHSRLVRALGSGGARSALSRGTARNWTTARALGDLLAE